MDRYNFKKTESKWQKKWVENENCVRSLYVVKNKDRNITKLENQIVFDVSLSGFIKKAFRKIRVI